MRFIHDALTLEERQQGKNQPDADDPSILSFPALVRMTRSPCPAFCSGNVAKQPACEASLFCRLGTLLGVCLRSCRCTAISAYTLAHRNAHEGAHCWVGI
ncbi:unnamed protein product [Mesocestoides corti]|uniref:Uncharacterized protein n=1 Tax=Mesocestoides corti TaxID=53468 RepID=A0A0R3UMR2_MESCO|nr:unnamed protein product [Mesocestoides corti]